MRIKENLINIGQNTLSTILLPLMIVSVLMLFLGACTAFFFVTIEKRCVNRAIAKKSKYRKAIESIHNLIDVLTSKLEI